MTETSISPHAPRESLEAGALAGLAFFAHGLPDALQFARHLLVGGDDLVEGVGDLSRQPVQETGSRTEKSPSCIVCRLSRMAAMIFGGGGLGTILR